MDDPCGNQLGESEVANAFWCTKGDESPTTGKVNYLCCEKIEQKPRAESLQKILNLKPKLSV